MEKGAPQISGHGREAGAAGHDLQGKKQQATDALATENEVWRLNLLARAAGGGIALYYGERMGEVLQCCDLSRESSATIPCAVGLHCGGCKRRPSPLLRGSCGGPGKGSLQPGGPSAL
jgi:hypothetical protein